MCRRIKDKRLSKEELRQLIIDDFCDKTRKIINLSELDFGDYSVNLSKLKAEAIFNVGQKAKRIDNSMQEAELYILNNNQESKRIDNKHQKIKGE